MNKSFAWARVALAAVAATSTLAATAATSTIVRVEDTPAPVERFAGVDLSYVNEVEACGAQFRLGGKLRDPYELFAEKGANLVRLRLWNDPTWTNYSTEADVTRSSERAKKAGMNVLLDFHYSDDWADPQKQTIPAAWAADIDDSDKLAAHVYEYTRDVLKRLGGRGLMPYMVQVGNEINTQMLRPAETPGEPIDWARNAKILNAGIRAVRDAGVHLAFFSGNDVFWKIRWEPGTDPSRAPYRTLVTYKETHDGKKIENDVDFCNALLEAKGVACVPGSAFGDPNALRISYTCPTAQLQPGLDRFREFFAELV